MSSDGKRMIAELSPQDGGESDDELTPEQKLAEFFGAAPNDLSVGIYEIDPSKPREPAFLFAIPSADLPPATELFAQILDKWGPGRYEAMAHAPGGKICFKQRFTVGREIDRKRARIPSRQDDEPTQTAPAAAAGVSPDVAAILEHQSRMFETMLERMGDARSQQPAPTVIEVAQQLAQIKDLFRPEQPTTGILEMLKDVLAIKDQLSDSNSENSSPLASAVKSLAPTIERALDRLSTGTPLQNPASAPDPANGEDNSMRAWVAQLKQLAERETPPVQAAQQVLEALVHQPAWVEQAVLTMVIEDAGAAADNVCQLDPSFAQFKAWLVETAQHIAAAVTDDDGAGGAEAETEGKAPVSEPVAAQAAPRHARGGS